MAPSDRFNILDISAEYLPPGKWRLMMPAVSKQYLPLIGAVGVFWGDFEHYVNELLACFVTADQSADDARWQTKPFKKRKALLKAKVDAHFGKGSVIAKEVASILSEGAEIHWKRNLVTHGFYQTTNQDGQFLTTASGVVNGRYVKLPVTVQGLERMYHQLGVLSLRLMECADPSAKAHNLSSRSRSRLQAFVRKHPPNLPTPQMLARQHPPVRVKATKEK